MKKVIVVGAGFGGLNFIRNASSNKEIEFTLIDKQNHHLFQPLLYQVATAVLSPANIAFPIRRMFKKSKNVKVVLGEVTSVDRDKKNVELDSGIMISWLLQPAHFIHTLGMIVGLIILKGSKV